MKTMKEVDVVLVGGGWTGGILGKEFSEAGMTVVCLERGGPPAVGAHAPAEGPAAAQHIENKAGDPGAVFGAGEAAGGDPGARALAVDAAGRLQLRPALQVRPPRLHDRRPATARRRSRARRALRAGGIEALRGFPGTGSPVITPDSAAGDIRFVCVF